MEKVASEMSEKKLIMWTGRRMKDFCCSNIPLSRLPPFGSLYLNDLKYRLRTILSQCPLISPLKHRTWLFCRCNPGTQHGVSGDAASRVPTLSCTHVHSLRNHIGRNRFTFRISLPLHSPDHPTVSFQSLTVLSCHPWVSCAMQSRPLCCRL